MSERKSFEDYGIVVKTNGPNQQQVECPNCHPEKRRKKKLGVNLDKGVWHCWVCNWTGALGYKASEQREFKTVQNTYQSEDEKLKSMLYKFFSERKISTSTVDENLISTAKDVFFPSTEKRASAICFNYFVGDNLVNVKYRGAGKHFTQSKGGEKVFYGLNNIALTDEVIITEGEIDALSFYEVGLKNSISVPAGGIGANENIVSKLEFFDNCIRFLQDKKRFYLALDKDEKGQGMQLELARRLGKQKCFIIDFPDDCKDANDVLQKYNQQTLIDCFKKAKPYPIDGIHTANQYKESLNEIYFKGYGEREVTGWEKFDNCVKRTKGQIALITGIPNHGKTTWALDYMGRLNQNKGFKFAIFSPEHSIESLTIKLLRQTVGKNFEPEYGDRMSYDEVTKAREYINDNYFFIKPENATYKLEEILNAAEYLVFSHGIKGILIDSWSKLQHLLGGNQTETLYTATILNQLSEFAKRHEITIYLIAHPRKMMKDTSKKAGGDVKNYEVVGLYDVSGSAHFANLIDLGFSVFRRFKTDGTSVTELHILKVREDWMGKLGTIFYKHYNPSALRFNEQEEGYKEGSRLDKELQPTNENETTYEIYDTDTEEYDVAF